MDTNLSVALEFVTWAREAMEQGDMKKAAVGLHCASVALGYPERKKAKVTHNDGFSGNCGICQCSLILSMKYCPQCGSEVEWE